MRCPWGHVAIDDEENRVGVGGGRRDRARRNRRRQDEKERVADDGGDRDGEEDAPGRVLARHQCFLGHVRRRVVTGVGPLRLKKREAEREEERRRLKERREPRKELEERGWHAKVAENEGRADASVREL